MRTMRTPYIVGAALALVAIVAPAAWYFTARPNEDQLNNDLRSLGYLPITPPSNLLNLGSLYYVDSDVKFFKTICSVKNDDLKDAVVESPSTSTLADELHAGQYSIGVKLDSGTAGSGHGDVGDKYVTKIHYSLSDVHLYEIALGTNHRIYSQLMAQEDCNDAVVEYLNAGGYVCQGQQNSGSDGRIRSPARRRTNRRCRRGDRSHSGCKGDQGGDAYRLKCASR